MRVASGNMPTLDIVPVLCYARNMNTLLGQRIRALRRAKGLTSDAVARGTALEAAHLRAIEHGLVYPTGPVLRQIATALEADYVELAKFDPVVEDDLQEWVRTDPHLRALLRGMKDSNVSPAFVSGVLWGTVVQGALGWALDPS